MTRIRLGGIGRRWLLAAGLAGTLVLAGAINVAAIGLQYANSTENSCSGYENGGTDNTILPSPAITTQWLCAVTVSTNVGPVPPGMVDSAGEVDMTATYTAPGLVPAACPLSSGIANTFSFTYQDALGGFSFSTTSMPYFSVDGSSCRTNYAGLASAIQLTNQYGAYSLMQYLCTFSASASYQAGPGTTIDTAVQRFQSVLFRVNNGASGACTPSNT